ncbi:hypothetical protein ACF08M_34820 [Streptomyces sp. NPDC015032]|uniref:hypothetical protein n=1 Tax=Streptomyces sp. NPDC015032 TaxID=3364937 RepID=UPI0037025E8D
MANHEEGKAFAGSLFANFLESRKAGEAVHLPGPVSGWVKPEDIYSFKFLADLPGVGCEDWKSIPARQVEVERHGLRPRCDTLYEYVTLYYKPKAQQSEIYQIDKPHLEIRPDSHPMQVLKSLTIDILTGSDDVRVNSLVDAYIQLASGPQVEELSFNLNHRDWWKPWTDHTISWTIQSKLFTSPLVGYIRRFGIRFTSGNRGFPWPDTGDNWNMNRITVTYPVDNASDDTLLSIDNDFGSPIHRFISDHDEWHVDFPAAPPPPSPGP